MASTTPTLDITHRSPFEGVGASGAWFERGQLDDGRTVVLKHLPSEGDWISRGSDGLGRSRWLWESGLLERLAATVDHPVLGVIEESGHDVVVMEDVGAHLAATDRVLPPRDLDGVLTGMAAMHDQWEGSDLEGLCSPGDRHRILFPAFHLDDPGPNHHPRREKILAGWAAFAEHAPPDVVRVIDAVHADPGCLERRLRTVAPATFLHGDLRPANLGLRNGRLLAIDWGELAGQGPAEMDLAWFAGTSTMAGWMQTPRGVVDLMPDDVFRLYEERSARPLDLGALDAACIGMVAQAGFLMAAATARLNARPDERRARAAQLTDWWFARVRAACERWSPA